MSPSTKSPAIQSDCSRWRPPIIKSAGEPLLRAQFHRAMIAPGSVVYTDEYDIYDRLPEWGYIHRTVCPAAGEYARDDDGDGFCEVYVNTLEGFWSLLRSWLRPHRGISQERLPIYLGFFEFVHNIRRRGKALLGALIGLLVAPWNPG